MWRFLGFVGLVIAGLAVVFYYTGQAEDAKVAQSLKNAEKRKVVASPIGEAKAPIVKSSTPPKNVGAIRMGGSIVIPAELKPKEEMEASLEVENTNAAIVSIEKTIGATVMPGDLLVKLDDILVRTRLEAQKQAAGIGSDVKIKQAENAFNVYDKELKRNQLLLKTGASTEADVELSSARREQAKSDIEKAQSEKIIEQHRLTEVTQQLGMYQIKSRIPGTIVKIFKKQGNAARTNEPIMHIINDKTLIAEGALEAGFSEQIQPGATVILEPENDREAKFIFNGHTGAVTGLSIAPMARFLASSSDDGTVVLWDLQPPTSFPWIRLERADQRRVACKCIAVSPSVNNDVYQVVAGYADGTIYQWNVKVDTSGSHTIESKTWEKVHDSAINCITFRGDGLYAATGSDDRRVALWNAPEGKRLYWVQADVSGNGSAHSGAVTSVNFSKDGQFLLSTGTDNAIRRWKLGTATDGSELVKTYAGRTGDLGKINLSDDGRYLFAEHGEELRLLDSRTLEPVSVITSRRSGRFVQFAQVSQNGQWAVTATDQGRNLLIRLPQLPESKVTPATPAPTKTPDKSTPEKAPATNLNTNPASTSTSTDLWLADGAIGAHFTLPEAVRATNAVFLSTTANTFVFMGSSDNKIRIWQLPTATELTTPLLAKLVFKSPQVESGTGLIRVQAEFDNSGTRKLETGKRVTMIVYPNATDHK